MQFDEYITKIDDLYHQIEKGKLSYANASKQMNCSIYRFKKMLIDLGYNLIEKKAGRLEVIPTDEQIQKVTEYNEIFRVGYKRCYSALSKRGLNISQNLMHKIYEEQSMFLKDGPIKKKKHPHRFFALYKDQQWNTDLHEVSITAGRETFTIYLIAFIDDATRYVVHAELIPRKQAINAADALKRALQKIYRPHTLHSDNGMEFWGEDFQKVLEENSINFTTTTPHTPQENGKIERWWQNFDMSLLSLDNLDQFVQEYNYYWNHASLYERFGRKTTPAEARSYLESWFGKSDLIYIYTQ